jgi:hypothetical protein
MRLKAIHAIHVAIQTVDRILNANLSMTNIWASPSSMTHKQTR